MNVLKRIPPWLLIVLVVLYVVSPIDVLPDFLGLPGRLDDLLLSLLAVWSLSSAAKVRTGRRGASRSGRGSREARSGPAGAGQASEGPGAGAGARRAPDPYEVLGVSRQASFLEIQRKYRERLMAYHPDRVQHLGRELQELAERKTRELNEAYQAIRKARGG